MGEGGWSLSSSQTHVPRVVHGTLSSASWQAVSPAPVPSLAALPNWVALPLVRQAHFRVGEALRHMARFTEAEAGTTHSTQHHPVCVTPAAELSLTDGIALQARHHTSGALLQPSCSLSAWPLFQTHHIFVPLVTIPGTLPACGSPGSQRRQPDRLSTGGMHACFMRVCVCVCSVCVYLCWVCALFCLSMLCSAVCDLFACDLCVRV